MLLTIRKIPEGRGVFTQQVVLEGEQGEWLTCPQGLNCRAETDRLQSHIAVHLVYEGVIRLECSRCLDRFNYPVRGEFHVLLKDRSAAKNRSTPLDDDTDFYFDNSTDEIDIRSTIFDDIITSLPMKPLCSEQCSGIAVQPKSKGRSVAGKGAEELSDPRWEALKKLKK